MPGKRPSMYQALPHLEYMVCIKYGLELDYLDCIVVVGFFCSVLFCFLFLIYDIDLFIKGNFQQRVHKEANCKNGVSAWQGINVQVRVAYSVLFSDLT